MLGFKVFSISSWRLCHSNRKSQWEQTAYKYISHSMCSRLLAGDLQWDAEACRQKHKVQLLSLRLQIGKLLCGLMRKVPAGHTPSCYVRHSACIHTMQSKLCKLTPMRNKTHISLRLFPPQSLFHIEEYGIPLLDVELTFKAVWGEKKITVLFVWLSNKSLCWK